MSGPITVAVSSTIPIGDAINKGVIKSITDLTNQIAILLDITARIIEIGPTETWKELVEEARQAGTIIVGGAGLPKIPRETYEYYGVSYPTETKTQTELQRTIAELYRVIEDIVGTEQLEFLLEQLRRLENSDYQTGGLVPITGLYRLHAGEQVIPAHRAVTREIREIRTVGPPQIRQVRIENRFYGNIESNVDLERAGEAAYRKFVKLIEKLR